MRCRYQQKLRDQILQYVRLFVFTIRVLAGEEENHHTKSHNVVTEPTLKSVAVRVGLALVKL